MLRNYKVITTSINDMLVDTSPPSNYKIATKATTCLTFCVAVFTAQLVYGASPFPQQQTAPSSSKSAEKEMCEGTKTSPKPSSASSNPTGSTASTDSQAGNDASKDNLKLSTKTTDTETTDPQGQFCRRDRGEHGNWRPSSGAQTEKPEHPTQSPSTPIAEYSNGKLTIRAHGESFGTVLNAVKSATGIVVEMPAEQTNESIFTNVGPIPMRDALMALLEGSEYNYMIVEAPGNPQVAKRLILSLRRNQGAPASMIASAREQPAEPSETSVYGSQGFQDEAQAQTVEQPLPLPAQPTSIPSSVPVGVNVQQLATESHKTTGQVLDDLQKHQMQVLDDQATQSQQPQ